ncbi:MAG: Gfo/Idh/MocA family oxidoreductase, partial [Dehalococcoidia bacterium]
MTVRIGIVGSGFVASLHAQALQQTPDVEIVAAASPNSEHVWVFTHCFDIPHAFIDYRDMLQGDLVDAIIVACPNDLHCDVTLAAASAGKHVLVEKPLAMNLTECDRMIRACRDAAVLLMYGENLCFAPKYVRAKQLVDEGALGDIYYVRQLQCHDGPHADWFWDVNRSGGGVLMDMGCHSIAFCRWLFGNAAVESVSAELGRFVHRKRTKGDDHSLVVMRFAPASAPKGADGGIGVAENSWARAGGLDDRAEIYGSRGLTVADLARGSALSTYSDPGYGYTIEKDSGNQGWTQTGFDEAWSEGFPQEIAHFVECVRDG